jgi:hypothetical protein
MSPRLPTRSKFFQNARPPDGNVQRNRVRVEAEPQAFTLPGDVVRTIEERDAVVLALDLFCQQIDLGLRVAGRDFDQDEAALEPARRVLLRLR